MTKAQKNTIKKLHDIYESNIREYAIYNAKDSCSFETFKQEQGSEIVVIMVLISGFNDSLLPETTIQNLLIEDDGSFYEMDMMPLRFKTQNDVLSYIKTMKKIDYNEQ